MAGRLADFIDRQVKFLPLEDLDISELNVRRREITADLDELAKSLDRFGLHQPIVVAPKGERFAVVVGQRRYLAAKQLRWDQMPALVLSQPLERVQAILFSLSENIQRRDLSAQDKAEACLYLRGELGSVSAVAEALGVTSRLFESGWGTPRFLMLSRNSCGRRGSRCNKPFASHSMWTTSRLQLISPVV